MWTPYFSFLVAVALFYGSGPLVYPLAGGGTVQFLNSLVPIGPEQLLRTNLLDAVGVLAVLVGIGVVSCAKPNTRASQQEPDEPSRSPKAIAVGFLLLGGLLEYGLILPARFGFYPVTIPGVVESLGNLYLLGLLVLAYVVARGQRRWLLPFLVLWAIQLAVAFLSFRKHALVLAIMLPALGAYLADRRLFRLFLTAAIAGAVYLSVSQLFLWGRAEIYSQSGSIERASLSARSHIVSRWFSAGRPNGPGGGQITSAQAGWARLSFAPEQAFAMQRYDEGYTGDTLRNAAVVLVPRIIWPQKPVTTSLAVEFYELVTGRTSTHLGLTIFGEGYWDYGWAGVVALALAAGVVFGVTGEYTLYWVRRRDFLYLPSVAIGIELGLGGTRHFFINGVIGPAAFFVLYGAIAWLATHLAYSMSGGRQRNGKAGSPI